MTNATLTTAGRRHQSDRPRDAGGVPADLSQRARPALAVQEWSVRWSLYGEPPDGLPRMLALELLPADLEAGARRGRLHALYTLTLHEVPDGYGIYWTRHDRPPRRKTAEQRGAQRLANLKRRLAAKAPLFADEFLARELEQRPDYFAGAKDTAWRDQADAETAALYERLLTGEMGLVIYHRWWRREEGEEAQARPGAV